MHKDLSTSTLDLTGFAAARTLGCTSTDATTKIMLFAADSAGQSSGPQLIDYTHDPRGRPIVCGAGQTLQITDGSTFVGYATIKGGAPSAVWIDAAAQSVTSAATLASFGDGSDGTATMDGVAVVAGMTPSTNVYTATRDLFFANLTLGASITLNMAGFKLNVSGILAGPSTATISNNGGAGGAGASNTGGTAGAVSGAGSTAAGKVGIAGRSGNGTGTAGTATTTAFPGLATTGGAGGGDGTNAGGAGGACTPLGATLGGARNVVDLLTGGVFGTSAWTPYSGGAAGGSGAADNADAGGGGSGAGGGVLIVAANVATFSGAITAAGGGGGAGFSTSHDAGGGGGGQGGVAVLLARSVSGTPTVSAPGGLGGAKAGTNGVAGTAGGAGIALTVSV